MVKSVFIARKSDGMIFCEVSDECSSDKNLMSIRNKALDFMKSLQSKDDLHSVNIGSQNFMFHYKINDNIIYMAITDLKYPQKQAFAFLQDIHEGFMDELKNHFGTQSVSYYSKLETIDRNNYFIKFGKIYQFIFTSFILEKFIKKKKSEYEESGNKGNIGKLNKEITDLHSIMTENINLILDRENSLINIDQMALKMTTDSKGFKDQAYKTRMKLLFAKYSIFIALGVIFLLFILLKIYF